MSAEPTGEWLADFVAALPALGAVLPTRIPPDGDGVPPRQSAVLILLGEGPEGPDVLLTQRASTLRSHAGQVSFPGGAVDESDADPAAAAVREAHEETGLDPAGIDVVGTGPALYLPPSNYVVTPVLAWWRDPSPVRPVDNAEVERVVRVPLAALADPVNRFQVNHPSGLVGPGFAVAGLFVWGFTAAILSRLLTLAGWERTWDQDVRRPIPELGHAVPGAARP